MYKKFKLVQELSTYQLINNLKNLFLLNCKKFMSLHFYGIIIAILLFSVNSFAQKTYQKEYYDSGQLKEEGWVLDDKKVDYWKFYFENGNLKQEGSYKKGQKIKYWYFYSENALIDKEGHFKKGIKEDWWLFYDENGIVNYKCQLENNQKNGYCLVYKEEEIIKASKFKEGKKIKEWTSLSSFKKENNIFDLR